MKRKSSAATASRKPKPTAKATRKPRAKAPKPIPGKIGKIDPEYTVMSVDPGKNDMAWSLVRGTVIHRVGMFNHTINDFSEMHFLTKCRDFRREFDALIAGLPYVPDEIVVERFMARPGKGGGSVGESINISIGFMARLCMRLGIRFVLVMPSTWKTYFKRRHGQATQAERYGLEIHKTRKNQPVSDHECDAIGIAQWRIQTSNGSGSTKRQDCDAMPAFISQMESLWKERQIARIKAVEAEKKERESAKAAKAELRRKQAAEKREARSASNARSKSRH